MNTTTNPDILTEDVVRIDKYLPNASYDPVHLLQLAHNAHIETLYAISKHKREWEAFMKDGEEKGLGTFEVFTVWSDHSDCMDVVTTTISYSPKSSIGSDYTFGVRQAVLAISLANGYRISSPLFHCTTEEELMHFLKDKETPFKRYQNLEHIMERLRESEEGQATIRKIEREQAEKQKKESEMWFDRKPQSPKELYYYLTQYEFTRHPYQMADEREAVTILQQSINGWWKPRYIVDNACQKAYEFMDEGEQLLTITDDDIEWESLQSLPEKIVARAKAHSGHFPVLFRRFHNGEADVIWQINPDGRYYMDDDGFGMTDDEEIALVGTVDRTGKVFENSSIMVNANSIAGNGHQLVDYFDRDANALDIRSNGMYPSGVLSNLCSNAFRLDGVLCNSMEGFLQSLKHQDPNKQRQICQLKGGNARKHSVSSWQTDQIVWWREHAIDRQSQDYQRLLYRAYQALFDQNERFRTALMATRGITLVHTTGETDPYKTILTASEFCSILTEIRDNYDKRDKQLTRKKRIFRDSDGQLYELVPLPEDYHLTPNDEIINCKEQ